MCIRDSVYQCDRPFGGSQFARVVKGVDLRSTAGNCAWARTPQLTLILMYRSTPSGRHCRARSQTRTNNATCSIALRCVAVRCAATACRCIASRYIRMPLQSHRSAIASHCNCVALQPSCFPIAMHCNNALGIVHRAARARNPNRCCPRRDAAAVQLENAMPST